MAKKRKNISYFNIATTIVGLIIASLALWVSNRSVSKSDEYFKINSKSSDSLFSLQQKHSKELNDSIIVQLNKSQEVTNLQNKVVGEQLQISKQIRYDQIYADRPIVVNEDNIYTSLEDGKFHVKAILKNVGHRHAHNVIIRLIYVDDSMHQVFYNGFEHFIITIDPYSHEKWVNTNYNPDNHRMFKPLNKSKFFYCVDFSYEDLLLKERFGRTYYYYYDTSLSDDFFTYEKELQIKLKEFINSKFEADKMKLLNE